MENENIKTTMYSYYFNISNPKDQKAYLKLCDSLKKQGLKCFESWGNGGSHHKPFASHGFDIQLETKHLFSNQWNAAPIDGISENGLRVFDWAQDHLPDNKNIKKGHYLIQTEEMKSIRNNTFYCGYCGYQKRDIKDNSFCSKCLGSEYLEKKNLYMLRMKPVSDTSRRKELTEAELAHLMPLYINAQTETDNRKNRRLREEIETKYKKKIASAENEYNGMLWLFNNNIPLDNVIYYSHTNSFCFGWRNPMDPEVKSRLLDILSEFHYDYEFKNEE